MALFGLDDLANSAGTRTGNFIKDVANDAANFVCELYKDYPGALVPNALDSFNRGLWDTLCEPRAPGLPTPPSLPFLGGQCPVQYQVSGDADVFYPRPDVTRNYGWYCYSQGPGFSIGTELPSNLVAVLNSAGATSICNFVDPTGGTFTQPETGVKSIRITSVRRLDNQPDNCGNPPAPWYPITIIPDNRKTKNVTVNYNDGTNITIPMVYAPVTGQFGINVKVGDNNFNFNLGGVHIQYGAEENNETKQIERDVKDIKTTIKETEKYYYYYPTAPSSGGYSVNINVGKTSEAKKIPEELQWIKIELTDIPLNAKKQAGVLAQDITYAGWFQFVVDDFYLPREPIHFRKSIFKRPPGATGYSFTLYTGFKAAVSEYSLQTSSQNKT